LIADIKKSKDRYISVEDKISEYVRLTEDEIHTNKRLMDKLLQKGWKQEELLLFEDVIMKAGNKKSYHPLGMSFCLCLE
jgi:hypothetical protein